MPTEPLTAGAQKTRPPVLRPPSVTSVPVLQLFTTDSAHTQLWRSSPEVMPRAFGALPQPWLP